MHDDRTLLEIFYDSAKDIAGAASIIAFILAVAYVAIAFTPVAKPV